MFVIPLGLGTKIRRWPIVTLAIAALWVYVFVVDRSEQQISEGLFAAVAKTGLRDAARNLFVEYCKNQRGDRAKCESYAVLQWPGFPAKARWHGGQPEISMADIDRLEDENRRAETLRERFSDCGRSRSCFNYKDIIWSFSDEHRQHATAMKSLHSYAAFHQAEHSYIAELRRICARTQCLVRGNITLSSLFWSQVRHGGLLHLMGNLMALLMFGVYAEQRTHRLLYLAILIIGGSIGMAVHTNFFSGRDTIALGGSANVSAIMGMFYVFFFRSRMRFLVWLPRKIYLGSSFFADVRYCFPLFFLLADVAGGLDNGFSALFSDKVAHTAHLTGFAFGAAAALLIVQWRRLPSTLIYEGEIEDLHRLAGLREIGEQLSFADEIMRCNPDNMRAREIACTAALRWPQTAQTGPDLRLRIDQFLTAHLATLCAVHNRRGTAMFASQLIERLPVNASLRHYLNRIGQGTILGLADFAVARAHLVLALRLYDLFMMRFPLSVKYPMIEDYAAQIVAVLPETPQNIQALRLYINSHPDSPLAGRLGAWLSNFHKQARAV